MIISELNLFFGNDGFYVFILNVYSKCTTKKIRNVNRNIIFVCERCMSFFSLEFFLLIWFFEIKFKKNGFVKNWEGTTIYKIEIEKELKVYIKRISN